jgi:hypothetical protein
MSDLIIFLSKFLADIPFNRLPTGHPNFTLILSYVAFSTPLDVLLLLPVI